MPTENRSSNTDPRDVFIRLNPLGLNDEELRKDSTGFEDQRTHSDYLLFLAGYRETHPAPQPHPEPIAWMVGTAFWWTKEEAERDAAAMGLPMIPVGPIADTREVERLRKALKLAGHWCNSALNAAQRVDDGSESLGDVACLLRHQAKNIEATLSASAEPSAAPTQSGRCLDGGDCGIGGTCKWCPHSTVSPAQQPS